MPGEFQVEGECPWLVLLSRCDSGRLEALGDFEFGKYRVDS